MNTTALKLLDNVSASGAGAWMTWRGGRGSFLSDATTTFVAVQLEYMGPRGTALVAGTDTTLAAAGGGNFELPPGQIRANIPTGSPVGQSAMAVSTQ